MERQIIYYYQRGVASYVIAKKFGVSNTYVRKLLEKHGVMLRGHNITNKMSAQRRTPEENQEITKKASEANLGSVHTATHRVKLALARERKPNIDQVYEQPLIDFCNKNGISVIPQKAFDRFNVDLYFPEKNIVVEIFGGGFHNKKQAVELFNNKVSYLSKKKIPILVVWADQFNFSPEKIIDVVLNMPRLALWTITGDGAPTSRGRNDINLLAGSLEDDTHSDS